VPQVESMFRMTLAVNAGYFPRIKNQTLFVIKKNLLPLRYGNNFCL